MDSNFVHVTPSYSKVLASSVSYTLTFNNLDPIPIGGYILVGIPPEIMVSNPSALVCQASQATNLAQLTNCSLVNSNQKVNFTILFNSTNAAANTTLTLTISNIFTNPPTTWVSSFSI